MELILERVKKYSVGVIGTERPCDPSDRIPMQVSKMVPAIASVSTMHNFVPDVGRLLLSLRHSFPMRLCLGSLRRIFSSRDK
jgi:hypothetical protein